MNPSRIPAIEAGARTGHGADRLHVETDNQRPTGEGAGRGTRGGRAPQISRPGRGLAVKTLRHTTFAVAFLAIAVFTVAPSGDAADAPGKPVEVVRFAANPIIRPEMLPGRDGENINGPSLVRVPAWLPNPLGKYFLYFAHHGGKYIRLAYADHLEGPWKIYEPGTLRLEEAPGCKGHIASPEAVVDDERKEIRLYFHGPSKAGTGQKTFLARSPDGLHFKASDEVLGIFYWRVFRWDGWWYAMGKGGQFYRSRDGLTQFEAGANPLPGGAQRDQEANSPGPRHVALQRVGNRLGVYYTNIGDAPERILRCRLELSGDWKSWKASAPEEVLRPETEWEGARLPLKESVAGAMKGRENALRDPAIFVEDGRVYLLYSVAGESGLAIAELRGGEPADKSPPKRP